MATAEKVPTALADKYSETVIKNLKCLVDKAAREDRPTRERKIKEYKKYKYYWDGYTRIYWNEVAHDWRIWDVNVSSDSGSGDQGDYYDHPVNIYRAYLESIIAALSINIPGLICYPDDADNPMDLETAKAGDQIAKLIYRHADVQLVWLKALFIICTEGLVAAYNYTHESEEYGTYEEDEYKEETFDNEYKICPICETRLQDPESSDLERSEYDPGDEDVDSQAILKNTNLCPVCELLVTPELMKEKMTVNRIVGKIQKPKCRQCIEVYGGLYVKVSTYARRQKDTPYLLYMYETNPESVLENYPEARPFLKTGTSRSSGNDTYERWGRTPIGNFSESDSDVITCTNAWLRTKWFNSIEDEGEREELKELFPNGVKVVLGNDHILDACNESLDDHWTLTENPLSDYLEFQPFGAVLVAVQDITNDLINLTLQTIEHGIGETFVDSGVVNLQQYSQEEKMPGALTSAKALSGKSLGDGFYQLKTATLSGEVLPFAERVQQLGQLASGALPSLFGGAQPNSSKTAAQYSMSRAQALQRLQTYWKMVTIWWKNIFSKVIPAYIKNVVEDEKYVQRDDSGNFINVFIRKSQLEGKIGNVELEGAEQLPISWAQQKDILMQLLQSGHPDILQAMFATENIPYLIQAIGLTGFKIPNEESRQKQLEEIKILLESEPIEMGDGQFSPSVEIEPLIDDHDVEADICLRWLRGSAGRLAKTENPAGYMNVMLHYEKHIQILAQQDMQEQQQAKEVMADQNAAKKPGQNKEPKQDKKEPAAQQVKQNAGQSVGQ